MVFLIGIGEDSHLIGKGKDGLFLGGVKIPNFYSPDSNTDGDVIIHALFNAISSALGKRSVGYYFKNYNGSSIDIIKKALEFLELENAKIMNISISIIGKYPKIEKYSEDIRRNLSKLLNINGDFIGITATSDEILSAYGLGKGLKATVVILIKK